MSKSLDSFNTEEVIAGIRTNDKLVYEYLYRQYGHMITGHVLKNNGDEEDAQEMVQLVMIKLWSAVQEGRYDEKGKLAHYIYQVAANSWREELRRRRNRPQEPIGLAALQVEDESHEQRLEAIVKNRQIEAIYESLPKLQPACRKLIEYYHVQQGRLLDLAEQEGLNYNRLRKQIFDCRKKLQRIAAELLYSKRD